MFSKLEKRVRGAHRLYGSAEAAFIPAGQLTFFPGKATSADLYLLWTLNALGFLKVPLPPHFEAIRAHIAGHPLVRDHLVELNAAFAAGNTSQ